MKNDAGGVAVARADAAHAMPQVHAIHTAHAPHGAVMDGDHRSVALTQRQHERPRLHARTLLGHHELATFEIAPRLRKQYHHLQREHMLAVEILVQAVVVVGAVLQQQRRRPLLPGSVTARDEVGVPSGKRAIIPMASYQRLAIGARRE